MKSQIISNTCELQVVQKKIQEVDAKLQMVQDDIHQNSESPLWSDVVQRVVDSKFEGVQSNLSNSDSYDSWACKKYIKLYYMTLYDGSVTSLERSIVEKDLFAAAKKANGIMGVIKRTFTHLDLKCFSLLYTSLVRPQFEYGVSA